jgi:hypothetical protein
MLNAWRSWTYRPRIKAHGRPARKQKTQHVAQDSSLRQCAARSRQSACEHAAPDEESGQRSGAVTAAALVPEGGAREPLAIIQAGGWGQQLQQRDSNGAGGARHRARRTRLLRRLEGADPVNSANTGRLDYNMYNLVLNLI